MNQTNETEFNNYKRILKAWKNYKIEQPQQQNKIRKDITIVSLRDPLLPRRVKFLFQAIKLPHTFR